MNKAEQFLRSETKLAQIHLPTLAIVYTLWPIGTAPGRLIMKLYMGWARGEDNFLHAPCKKPHTDGWVWSAQTGSRRPNPYLLCLFTRG